ncbi:MAG: peptide ABC transporter substrate-binding protein [Clostridiales bacterium]|nr:peptide ABC transporter substrate-binding protein [Clostridiales bacterium]MDD7551003.1 peptide ABC transporter substrate-binding protein [Clostridia bacterium]MDY5754644.1 peptide ABC transporter substrate-binding protein [Eubacteriales bacterium]
MKKVLALLFAALMVFSCFACNTQGPAEEFELNVNIASEPESIDPALNTAVDGAVMINHMFEGLYKWIDDGNGVAKLVLGQAESVDVNAEKTVYTFKIRENAKWSDGQAVTASDFVYSWQRLVDPATAADYCYMADILLNANEIMAGEKDKSELGVKAIDEHTLEVTLHTPCPYFEEIMAFPSLMPVRQDMIEKGGDQWTFDLSTYVGNGPYKMESWEHNSKIRLVKSENYYDYAKLGPNAINFALMDDANAIYAAFNSGQLNFIEEVPVAEIPTLVEQGKLNIDKYIGTYYVCFQTQKAPFDDVRVRKAFSLAIDRNYIVEQITRTGQVPASGFVPYGVNDALGIEGDDFRTVGGNYMDVSKEAYEANCEEARRLLAEAGYEGGAGFPVVEYLYNTSDNHKAIGEALQQMWQDELGVTVNLVNQEWNTFLQTRKEGNYSIARNGWIADYNDPMSFLDMWLTGGGNNDAHYSNAEYDALIMQAKSTSDAAERMRLMHQAEDILMGEDVVHAAIYFYTNKYMAQGFTGMYYTPLGYYFFGYTKQA